MKLYLRLLDKQQTYFHVSEYIGFVCLTIVTTKNTKLFHEKRSSGENIHCKNTHLCKIIHENITKISQI